MSKELDEKIVSMEFDNRRFEQNVRTTMGTLDKLKKNLNFDETAKGLDGLEKSIKKVDFSQMGEAIEAVSVKFNALQATGFAVLENLASKAISVGEKIVKSLSIDQWATGFRKYENEMSNMQTMMNATGKSMDEIQSYMDKLAWYSDETSYHLDDMFTALSSGVAAGRSIEELVPMIEGVANATAFAGKSAASFTHIMTYAMNQALQLGYLGTRDWMTLKSISTPQYQQSYLDAAERLGKITSSQNNISNWGDLMSKKVFDKDVIVEANKSWAEFTEKVYDYREKLIDQGKYITTSQAMEEMAKQMSGVSVEAFKSAQTCKTFTEAVDAIKDAVSTKWKDAFKIMFGNLKEAKELWTAFNESLYPIFVDFEYYDKTATEASEHFKSLGLNDILAGMFRKDITEGLNAQELLWESLIHVLESIGAIGKVIRTAWTNIVPPDEMYAAFHKFVGVLRNLVEYLPRTYYEARKAQGVFEGLFTVVKIVANLIGDVLKFSFLATKIAINVFNNTLGKLLKKLFEFIGASKDSIKINDVFRNILYFITGVLLKLGRLLTEFFSEDNPLIKFGKTVGGVFATIGRVVSGAFGYILAKFHEFKDWIANNETASNILSAIGSAFKFIGEKAVIAVNAIKDWFIAVKDGIANGKSFSEIFSGVISFFKSIPQYIGVAGKSIKDWWNNLDQGNGKLDGFLKSIGSLFMRVRDLIKKGLGNANSAIMDKFGIDIYKAISNIIEGLKNGIKDKFPKIYSLISGVAKAIIEKFCSILGIQSPSKVFHSLGGFIITGLLNGIKDKASGLYEKMKEIAQNIIDKVKDKLGIHSPSKAFVAIGGFIVAGLALGLTGSFPKLFETLKEFGGYITERLSTGFTEGFPKLIDNVKKFWSKLASLFSSDSFIVTALKGTGITIWETLAAVLNTIKDIAEHLDFENVVKIAACVGMFVLIFKALDTAQTWSKNASKATTGFKGMFDSLKGVFNGARDYMRAQASAVKWQTITFSIKQMAQAIAIIAGVIAGLAVIGDKYNVESAALIVFGIMAGVMAMLIYMDQTTKQVNTKDEAKNIVKAKTSIVKMGFAMIELSAAMLIISKAAATLGKLNPAEFNRALEAMVIVVGAVGMLLYAVSKIDFTNTKISAIVAPILAIAGAMAVLALFKPENLLAAAEAMGVVSIAMVVLAAASEKLGGNKGGNNSLMNLVKPLLLISASVALVGAGMAAVVLAFDKVGDGASKAAEGFNAFASTVLLGFLDLIPQVIDKLNTAFLKGFEVLTNNLPTILGYVRQIMVAILDEIVNSFDDIGSRITTILGKILEYLPQILEMSTTIILAIFQSLTENMDSILDTIVPFLNKLLDGLSSRVGDLISHVTGFICSVLDGISENVGPIIDSIFGLIGGIVGGLAQAVGPLTEASLGPIAGMITGFFTSMAEAMNLDGDDMVRIIEAIGNAVGNIIDKLAPHLPDIIDAIGRFTDIVNKSLLVALALLAPIIKEITIDVNHCIVEIIGLLMSNEPLAKEILTSVRETIVAVANSISHVADSITAIANVFLAVVNSIVPSLKILGSIVYVLGQIIIAVMTETDTIVNDIFNGIIGIMEEVESTIETTLDGIDEIVTTAFEGINTTLETVLGGIKTVIETFFDGSEDVVRGTFEGIAGVISSPFEGVEGILNTALSGIKGIIDSIGTSFSNIGTGTKDLAEGISVLTDLDLIKTGKAIVKVTGALKDWSEYDESIKKVGEGLKGVTAAMSTVTTNISTMTTNVTSMIGLFLNMSTESANVAIVFGRAIESMVKTIEEKATAFHEGGVNIITSFADGIKAQKTYVDISVDGLLNAMHTKIKGSSKKFYSTGEEAGSNIVKGVTDAIAKISSIIENDPNMQPVIKPVMDLTELQNGITQMNTLLNGTALSGSTSMAGAANYSMNARPNDNLNLANALSELKDKLGENPSISYTINGITYNEDSSIGDAISQIVRTAIVNQRSGGGKL